MKIKLFTTIIISLFLGGVAKAAELPLVPCGGEGDPCKLCDLFVMLDRIFDFIFLDIIPPIAFLAIIAGGVYYFISAGDLARIAKAKSILTSVVIGLIIIYGSWLIINSFFLVIGTAEWTGLDNWFEYPCY